MKESGIDHGLNGCCCAIAVMLLAMITFFSPKEKLNLKNLLLIILMAQKRSLRLKFTFIAAKIMVICFKLMVLNNQLDKLRDVKKVERVVCFFLCLMDSLQRRLCSFDTVDSRQSTDQSSCCSFYVTYTSPVFRSVQTGIFSICKQ